MNKRYVPIIAFTLAVLLVSSVAYASEKKKKARLPVHDPNEMSEEALKVELLAATEGQQEKSPVTKVVSSKKRTDAADGKVKEMGL